MPQVQRTLVFALLAACSGSDITSQRALTCDPQFAPYALVVSVTDSATGRGRGKRHGGQADGDAGRSENRPARLADAEAAVSVGGACFADSRIGIGADFHGRFRECDECRRYGSDQSDAGCKHALVCALELERPAESDADGAGDLPDSLMQLVRFSVRQPFPFPSRRLPR